VAGCDGTIAEIARPDLARKPVPAPTPATEPAKPPAKPWLPLRADYLHDPDNPVLHMLQEPAEALSVLPRATSGNYVDWIAALRSGAIAPRTNIQPETKVKLLDLDILFEETAGQPIVRFPHLQHTEWLDCNNCHDKPFIPKKGANPINMLAILNGEYCGQCHGAVSFPLTECARCHSVPRGAPSAS
jgi:c(7)-type cytochrome triheme protein